MKKILIALILFLGLNSVQAQTANIGGDTLQWLRTHVEQQSNFFSGKPFKTVLDSLYQLKAAIVEYNPPMNIRAACGGTGVDGFNPAPADPNYLYVDSLTMYFEAITDGGVIDQIHQNLVDSNYKYNQHNTVNTHVKYFTVVFQQRVPYLRTIASSDQGTWLWTPFAEYLWGPNVIQRVRVGEY